MGDGQDQVESICLYTYIATVAALLVANAPRDPKRIEGSRALGETFLEEIDGAERAHHGHCVGAD